MNDIVWMSGVELLMDYMEGALAPKMYARPSKRMSTDVRAAAPSLRVP